MKCQTCQYKRANLFAHLTKRVLQDYKDNLYNKTVKPAAVLMKYRAGCGMNRPHGKAQGGVKSMEGRQKKIPQPSF